MSYTQITRILLVVIGTMTILAFVSACAPFSGEVKINATPVVMPTQAPAAAPVIIVQPAPVVMQPAPAPTPAPDYTPVLILATLTLMVVLVGVAFVLTRRPQQVPSVPPPAAAQLPPANVTHVTNTYHIYVGLMPGETRGEALARLVQGGMRLEDASAALGAPRSARAELPAPKGKS